MIASGLVPDLVRRMAAGTLDLVLPPRCVFCEEASSEDVVDGVCHACHTAALTPPDRQCRRCAAAVGPGLDTTDCMHCRGERFSFRRVVACAEYDSLARLAVLRAKQLAGQNIAIALANMLVLRINVGEHYDVVTAVPSHWQTRLLHPYHLADGLAEHVANRIRVPVDLSLLRKMRRTQRQARLPASKRRRNVRGAFESTEAVEGARVLLVDDVLTTGATANACAQALTAAGAEFVDVAAFARST